ncbi:MAG: hypothetical protein U9N61_00185 [Euryarchaeota archaeon]|nr:hypothetical protein [Euryarchaeota archaeon]
MAKEVKEIANSIENMLNELREVWYAEGCADGYNAAIAKPPMKRGSTDELKELEEEVSK